MPASPFNKLTIRFLTALDFLISHISVFSVVGRAAGTSAKIDLITTHSTIFAGAG
jgi:hypothetical protein